MMFGPFRCDPEQDGHLYQPADWSAVGGELSRVMHWPTKLVFRVQPLDLIGPGSLANFPAYLSGWPDLDALADPVRLDELGRAAVFASFDAVEHNIMEGEEESMRTMREWRKRRKG